MSQRSSRDFLWDCLEMSLENTHMWCRFCLSFGALKTYPAVCWVSRCSFFIYLFLHTVYSYCLFFWTWRCPFIFDWVWLYFFVSFASVLPWLVWLLRYTCVQNDHGYYCPSHSRPLSQLDVTENLRLDFCLWWAIPGLPLYQWFIIPMHIHTI